MMKSEARVSEKVSSICSRILRRLRIIKVSIFFGITAPRGSKSGIGARTHRSDRGGVPVKPQRVPEENPAEANLRILK